MTTSPHIVRTFINFFVNLISGFLLLRVALKLFGAATRAPFVQWVYETTEPLLKPFAGMFPSPQLAGGFTIEFSSLFAIMVYAFIGYVAIQIIDMLMYNANKREKTQTKK